MTTRAIGGLNSSEEREGQQMVPAHGRKQMHGPDRRNLQLRFQSMFPDSFFTKRKVEGQRGAPIHVNLIDTSTGLVRSGPESCVKLKVVVVEGNFNNEDDDDWTQEDFESRIVKEREGKSPLLIGKLHVQLKEGVGALGDLFFTDNSSWTRSKKFRLGVKVASGLLEGIRVREAITNPFVVKECRGEGYKKHELPALGDEVWRLKQIHRNGPFHKRLNNNGIFIVEHFLWCLGTDPKGLRTILGSSLREKMWDALVEHANTCDLRGKHYVYYADNMKNFGVVFKSICEFSGYIAGGKYNSAETLSYSQKGYVDTLVKKAYANFRDIVVFVEYDGDGGMALNIKQNEIASTSQTNVVIGGLAEYSVSFEQPAVSQPHLPPLIPSEQAIVNSGFSVRDFPEVSEQQISVQCQPSSVYSQQALVYPVPTVEDNPVSFDQQDFVPHPPSTDTVPSSQPSMRQSIRDYPDSFHPQTFSQPCWVPSWQNSVNYIDQRASLAFPAPVAPPEPELVNPVLDIGAPVPCQTPSVPSWEAYWNSMLDFEESFPRTRYSPQSSDRDFFGLPASCVSSEYFLSKSARYPEPAGSPERLKNSEVPISRGVRKLNIIHKLPAGGSRRRSQRNICSGRTKNLGNVKSEFRERGGARGRLLGSSVKMEGGNTSSLLSERKEGEETASLDSKFEGLSLA